MSTIVITSSRASALASAGTADNPIVAYNNRASIATMSTTQGTAVTAAVNASTGSTYDAWTATATAGGEAQLQAVFGSAPLVNFCAIAAHNLGTLGASVRLQYSDDSGSTWTPVGVIVSPEDDEPLGWYIENITETHWRFQITSAGSGGEVAIAVAYIGQYLQIPQRIYQGYTPPITPTEVNLQSNVSAGGNFIGSAVTRRGSRLAATVTHLSPDFVRGAAWQAAQKHFNDGGAMFWAWRPTEYDDLKYVWRDGAPIRPTNSGPRDYMSFDLEMRAHEP